jgi:transposase
MIAAPDELPSDIGALKTLVLRWAEIAAAKDAEIAAKDAELTRAQDANARLWETLRQLRRARFGRKSEKLDPDQLSLAMEETEQAIAENEAQPGAPDATLKASRTKPRSVNRGALPSHLPREEIIIEPENKSCPCCNGAMHVMGEARSERLDVIPAQFKVIVTRRPKYACRRCGDAVVQAPAPARLVEGGIPTENLIAHVLVAKYADHLPLYRQAQIYARQGVDLDRSTLADWVGRAAALLAPVQSRLFEILKASPKLFADETRAPVLDPGRGKVKLGQLWAYARDDRPWGGNDPPGAVYCYAPGRGSEHVKNHLAGFTGILQVDGYAAYKELVKTREPAAPIVLAFCWAHARRRFYEIAAGGNAPLAEEALRQIAALYKIEEQIRGQSAGVRHRVRQAQSLPRAGTLKTWLDDNLKRVPGKSKIAEAMRYAVTHWQGLMLFLGDGRIEMDSNAVERAIRPIALNRKNALFAGHDRGGDHWATVASLIETCKLNAVDPQAYLASVLSRLVNGWPNAQINDLLPWAYASKSAEAAAVV